MTESFTETLALVWMVKIDPIKSLMICPEW